MMGKQPGRCKPNDRQKSQLGKSNLGREEMEKIIVASLPRAFFFGVFAQLQVEGGKSELAKERVSSEFPLGSSVIHLWICSFTSSFGRTYGA